MTANKFKHRAFGYRVDIELRVAARRFTDDAMFPCATQRSGNFISNMLG
jgi:methionine salvage enolase-phosphatase E1